MKVASLVLFLLALFLEHAVHAFHAMSLSRSSTTWSFQEGKQGSSSQRQQEEPLNLLLRRKGNSVSTSLAASSNNNDDKNQDRSFALSKSDQTVLGVAGTVAALVTLYSEFTLKTTGCGIPAGPFGLFGLVEGFSYLGVVGMASYSIVTKTKTGSGLPAGPGGLLGAAEGLSFLAILAGLVVLGFQVTDYGYIPNAVPMEGGMCS